MENPPTTMISTKGQVILPKAVRDHQQWGLGTRLVVEETADGVMLRPVPAFARTELGAVAGRLAYGGAAKSVEEMDPAVVAGAKQRNAGD